MFVSYIEQNNLPKPLQKPFEEAKIEFSNLPNEQKAIVHEFYGRHSKGPKKAQEN